MRETTHFYFMKSVTAGKNFLFWLYKNPDLKYPKQIRQDLGVIIYKGSDKGSIIWMEELGGGRIFSGAKITEMILTFSVLTFLVAVSFLHPPEPPTHLISTSLSHFLFVIPVQTFRSVFNGVCKCSFRVMIMLNSH